MTSPSFVPEAGCGPSSTAASYSSTQTPEAHNTINNAANTNARSNNPPFANDSHVFHAHRQNHNSSKLPAFRFADLKKDHISLPSLLQHIPPSPVSPQDSSDTLDEKQRETAHEHSRRIPGSSRDGLHHFRSAQTILDKSVSFEAQPQSPAQFTRTRSLKFKLPSSTPAPADPSTGSKRPASFPDIPRTTGSVYATRSQLSYVATPVTKRRLTASAVVHNATAPIFPRPQLNSTLPPGPETNENAEQSPAKESAQAQQEPGLLETAEATKSEDKKTARPPVSHKQLNSANPSSGRPVIPPIRSFRSSGSRKSVVLDLHGRRVSEDSIGDEMTGSNQRDRALRALEGRGDDDYPHLAPQDAGEMTATTDNDNTADIFMKIAREDTARHAPEDPAAAPEPSAISRIIRTAHRRPLSAAIPSYQASSPPQVSRRLSDPRQNSRGRQDGQPPQQKMREPAYRSTPRENPPPIITTSEAVGRAPSARTPMRPSPITPKQISFKDSFAEGSSPYKRRRQSITESNSLSSSTRTIPYKSSHLAASQARTYHSSPLVPKSANVQKDEHQHGSEAHPGAEGTESSSSTAAPSTVWDELDDLKSRIHRLELTGKMPSTSGVSMSRSSDDRPRTATTNATTMSTSPKRSSGAGAAQAEGGNTESQPRETQPLLLSALGKTKGLVSLDVFSAIESAATDALALSSMMGAVGQPGPISSGASTIGFNGGVTDRQLRRKADSICRSLTELCIALAGEMGQQKTPRPAAATHENELLASPTFTKPAAASIQRRPSAIAEAAAKPNTSPRTLTTLEQRRQTMLAATALPSSRYATAPGTPMEPMSAGRKSSLLLARIRRTATEEPEESPGRRSSLLLRTRRTGTEELEENREGRKTSLLLRSRKTMNEEEDESRFRAPSRAITEVNSFRTTQRDFAAQSPPEPSPLTTSALPRRRHMPSALPPRIINNSLSSAPVTPARRYLERTTPLSEPNHNMADKYAEDRAAQRHQISLSQTAMLNRSGSLGRRNRETGIPSYSSAAHSAQATPSGPERYR